jgi:acylglycerol lipase
MKMEEGKMEISEWNWKTFDDLEMYTKAWIPESSARGVICLVHGVGEHVGRYQADGEALARAGYILAGFDIRGFGRSAGRRGHTPSLEAYFKDIDSFLDQVSQKYPGLPRFLYGNSMGAILILAYVPVRQPSVSGAIATAAGLKTSLQEQKFKVFLAKFLGSIIPELTMVSGIDAQLLSRDPQVAVDYENDPLVHHQVTTSWGKTMLAAIDVAMENACSYPIPLLLMHAGHDRISYPSGSQGFYDLSPKDKVDFKLWEDCEHELHTDLEKADVFKTMINWLDHQEG